MKTTEYKIVRNGENLSIVTPGKTKIETKPTEGKKYYDNADLNRIANDRRWGMVFGEKTMLGIMSECCDDAQFIQVIEESL